MTKHNHYFKNVAHLQQVDVYRILELFEVTCPVAQHIVKKALAAGKRGAKSPARDMQDIVDSASRWLAMREEDARALDDAAEVAKSMTGVEMEMKLKQARKNWDDAYKAALSAPLGGFIKTSFIPTEEVYSSGDTDFTARANPLGYIDALDAVYNLTRGAA